MIKIAIVGCGKMGRVHAEVFGQNSNCLVTGFYNRTIEKAYDLQKGFPQARVYDRWEELIADPRIDAIAISTPQVERLAQYKAAIKAGKHVFLEKPMGLGLNDSKEVLDLLEDSSCCFYVDSQIRSQPTILTIDKILPRIGTIFHIDMEFSMFREEVKWKHKLIAGGGVLRELGGHMIDQAGAWLGPAKSVTAVNMVIVPGREVEDQSLNLVEYKSGATLSLINNYFEHKGALYQGRILGKEGQIDFTFSSYAVSDAQITLFDRTGSEQIAIDLPAPEDINTIYPGHMDSFKKEIARFLDLVKQGLKAEDTLDREWQTAQVIAGSYQSTRLDRKIKLPLDSFDHETLADCYINF